MKKKGKKASLVECTEQRSAGLHYADFSCSMAAKKKKGEVKFASLVPKVVITPIQML